MKKIRKSSFWVLLLLVDLSSKFLFRQLDMFQSNLGAGLGFLNAFPVWVVILSLLLLLLLFRCAKQIEERLILWGGLANFLDRLVFGSVTDWLQLPLTNLWFNLADVYIVAGIGLVLLRASKIRGNEATKNTI